MRNFICYFIVFCFIAQSQTVSAQRDSSFYSPAFGVEREYRIYLPADYDAEIEKEYPVIYYFHGWGGRYKWDNYVLSDDPGYPDNGRNEPPFVMEWRDYSQSHDVIIITWDGYEPNLHPGQSYREGVRYGGCNPYDFPRAHEYPVVHWGWDFKMYFRDLVAHVDSAYRTIANRDHRGVTGLSMGGLTALYVSGQNKDLVGSVSAFCPADNIPKYGPKGHLSVFPVNEMYRSLKGIPMRLSANDGDWLLANDLRMKRIFEGSGFDPFEFHMANFPDHWAADAEEQLDFHMKEFAKKHQKPLGWNHICPSFKTFDQWGYHFTVERDAPALSILEDVSDKQMKIFSRTYIPNGPIVLDETIHISTDTLYTPSASYDLLKYNLTTRVFTTNQLHATMDGKLEFDVPGGGHLVGIHSTEGDPATDIQMVDELNRDYLYFEQGKECSLGFRMVNIGNQVAKNISIRAFSSHPFIAFTNDEINIPVVENGEEVLLDSIFNFSFSQYLEEYLGGNIQLEIKIGEVAVDTQDVVFFATPKSTYAPHGEVIVLDGQTVFNVPVFSQQNNMVEKRSITGGTGNGNGIAEKGEEIEVYIMLEQGLAPGDQNTYHKTYLIDHETDPYVSVVSQKYDEKRGQASSTSILSLITLSDSMPDGYEPDLWFRLESLYNNSNVPESRTRTYQFRYDYKRAILITEDTTTVNVSIPKIKDKTLSLNAILPNPFWDSVRILFNLDTAAMVNLSVFDIYGKKIRELKNAYESMGAYAVDWDGKNSNCSPCPPGIYFYRLMVSDQIFSGKMLKM